jgi:hypothetical protein
MTVGEEVYQLFKGICPDAVPCVVKAFFPNAKVIRTESMNAFTGKKVEWNIVSQDQRTAYSPVSLKGEHEAWLYALERACRTKWPMPMKEMTQEGL